MTIAFLEYNKKLLNELEELDNPDVNLMKKYKKNIKHYEKILDKMKN